MFSSLRRPLESMIRPSSSLGVFLMIVSFAFAALNISVLPLTFLMLLRPALSPLAAQRVLLMMIVHQLHLYIHLMFGVTGHQPAIIVRLLFLWGSHLGRLAGRLLLRHFCACHTYLISASATAQSRWTSTTLVWIHSTHNLFWTVAFCLLL